jgi:predicted acetyltransferase
VDVDITLRYARRDELAKVVELDGASFGLDYSAVDLDDVAFDIVPERVLVAVDGERFVGISAELPAPLSLPGGGDVNALGITWVSVEITHRRRGVLRAMVEKQLRDGAAAGFAAAVLLASEGGIYGRYGFGIATQTRRTVVDRRRAELARPVDTSAVERLTTDAAREILPGLFDRWRATTPGAFGISEARWKYDLLDREHQRYGRTPLFHLVHPDGYVSYRVKGEWSDNEPQHQCWITQYAPITAEAHAALWQTLLSMDLVATIESHAIPLDDPLPWLLTDFRRVGTAMVSDGMWIRPLDVAALLSARTYAVEVDTVLAVDDALLGDARYRLRGGPDGATCERTHALPAISLDVASLGAISLGGTRLQLLARTGVIEAEDKRLLSRLDRAFLADRAPRVGSHI